MTEPKSDQFRLHLLGTPDLRAPDGRRVTSVLSQPRRLCLLAYVALSPTPVSRGTVAAHFWPESDEGRARNALSQALFYLRRSLGVDVVQSVEGDRLWVPSEHLWCDARELLQADAPPAELIEAAHQDLLAGWIPDDSQPLQDWLDGQRRKVRERAEQLGSRGDSPAAADGAQRKSPETAQPRREVPPLPRHRQWPRFRRVHAFIAVVITIAVAAVWLGRPLPSDPSPAIGLAVLMPVVMAGADAPELRGESIYLEVLAHLPVEGIRVFGAPSADSLQELQMQLRAIGTPEKDWPEWILVVDIRVASGEAIVIPILYRTATLEVLGSDLFDVTLGGADAVLMKVPEEIARGVVRMVAETLAGDEGRSR